MGRARNWPAIARMAGRGPPGEQCAPTASDVPPHPPDAEQARETRGQQEQRGGFRHGREFDERIVVDTYVPEERVGREEHRSELYGWQWLIELRGYQVRDAHVQ